MQIGQGSPLDASWLYLLYCTTMRVHIENTWGWDEKFQRNGFKSNLPPEKFKIIALNEKDVGAFLVDEEPDHFWIEMLLVQPDMQGRGIGTKILKMLQVVSQKHQKPIKLSVIKTNPARHFYHRLGFQVYDEDDAFFKMKWGSDAGGKPS